MRRPPGPLLGRPSDLPPASVLGIRHKHGTKMRYMAGCRCRRCRRGNTEYEAHLNRNRKLFGPNDLVSSSRVRDHLLYLQQFGIGHKTVAKHAHVGKTALSEIIWSGRQHIRRRSEARVLAVQPTMDTLPLNVNIPATEIVYKIKQLLDWGYPRCLISRDALKTKTPALQLISLEGKTKSTNVRTAKAICGFHKLILEMRQIWGEIPPRHYVYWKTKRGSPKTPTKRRLKLIPFAVTYDYNRRWSGELKEASSMMKKLKTLYRKKGRELNGTETVGPA